MTKSIVIDRKETSIRNGIILDRLQVPLNRNLEDVAYAETIVHFPCFGEMAEHDLKEKYGVRPVDVKRAFYIGIKDKPLTEEQKRQNQDKKRNAQLQEEYNDQRQRLVNILDDKIFLADSLALIASQLLGGGLHVPRQRLEYEEANEDLPLSEKKRNIGNRLTDAGLTLPADIKTLNTLSKVLLSQNFENLNRPEPNTPDIFYRAIRSDSHGRYDKHLGFRSSRQPFTLPPNHGGPLHESSLVDKDILKNHCEGNRPSDLIAMSDSPARILRLIKHWDFDDLKGDMIAVINVSKLLAMRVLFNRATTLAKKMDIETWAPSRTRGLSWVNPNYWVAYRWVPAECIEFCISVASLRSACKEHDIGKLSGS